jgi:hypothetical protein
MPIATVDQRDRTLVDLDAHVPACCVRHSSGAPRDAVLVSINHLWNGEAALVRHGHRARSCRQAASVWPRVRVVMTKYGQHGHNTLRLGKQWERQTCGEKSASGAAVPHLARVQVGMRTGGIANAPTPISKLRV